MAKRDASSRGPAAAGRPRGETRAHAGGTESARRSSSVHVVRLASDMVDDGAARRRRDRRRAVDVAPVNVLAALDGVVPGDPLEGRPAGASFCRHRPIGRGRRAACTRACTPPREHDSSSTRSSAPGSPKRMPIHAASVRSSAASGPSISTGARDPTRSHASESRRAPARKDDPPVSRSSAKSRRLTTNSRVHSSRGRAHVVAEVGRGESPAPIGSPPPTPGEARRRPRWRSRTRTERPLGAARTSGTATAMPIARRCARCVRRHASRSAPPRAGERGRPRATATRRTECAGSPGRRAGSRSRVFMTKGPCWATGSPMGRPCRSSISHSPSPASIRTRSSGPSTTAACDASACPATRTDGPRKK